ncbi:MAG: diguanylate cyclase [Acidobacteria bacterium]|nr:MAG: diguanylate cyclase [Acidobacteriota bacterium]PYY08841.1 MAG: diguanylate cyclase [Acidobacteriota bacterium]
MPDKPLEVRRDLNRLVLSVNSPDELMSGISRLLHDSMPKYNWVGFYILDTDVQPPVLVLGPFQGAMTPHPRIPLNQGICGAAASTGKTVVVDDVSADPRYLACSTETKSEIVVPILVKGKVVGELDIDSHYPAAFSAEDRELIEHSAALVGEYLETSAPMKVPGCE